MWSNAATYFEASTQLRELQNMFNSSQNAHGTCSKSKPTSTNVPQPMDTSNNIGITGEQLNNLNHESQQSQAPNQNFQSSDQNQAVNQYQTPAPTFNNVSKTCRNEVCKKPFTASNPKFYCCSKECVATWKLKRYGAEDQARKKKPKSFNNMSAPASNNNADTDAVSKKYYITPCHVYSAGSNIPIVIRNSLFDTGASLTFITIDLLKKLNLEHIMTRDADDKGVRGGDQRPMKGYIGRCELEVAIEDTTGFLTKNFKQEMLVYEGLNHDLVIGQDAIGDGIRSFFGIPLLDLLIFNPTTRQMKTANNRLAEFEKKSFNNFNSVKPVTKSHFKSSKAEEVIKSEKCFSETKVYESATVYSSSAPEFSDAESFLLNIPQSKLNESMRCLFEEKVSELTTGFLNNVEQYGETSLSDILTTGGLDGTFDTKNIKVEDTKIIETSKGQVKVGQQLSDNMCKKFAKFVSDFKGKVFDHTTLGQTKQECCPEMKPGESSTPTIPKYMPLNPFMQSEARVLVQQMVDLGVLEKCNEPANSTIFIVQKSSGKWRLICDLKDYNKKIVDYVVHLPSPFELINKICTFKMFSYLDFSDAYFQVPLSEKCLKENPIVASVSGLQYNFKYLKMAQGLKIATAWFIGILNNIYAKVSDWVVNYLDDSVLGSDNDEEQHFVRAVEFVKITNEAGLRISLPKSVFFATDLCFLNYSLTNGAWSLSENQRKTINSLNTDNLTKQKRESLAAFINHFNRFHTGVSFAARKIRDPTTSADSVKSILDNIKKSLIESPALKTVNFKDPLYIYTDASKYDCAGVITQRGPNGVQLVTCFSKKFPESVVNKPVHERELWAMQQLTITYRYLLIGRHKKVFLNDNRIVLAAEKSKAPSLRCLFDTIKSSFSNVEFKFVSTDKNSSDCFTRLNNLHAGSESVSDRTEDFVISETLKKKILKIHVNAGCCAPKRVISTFQGLGLRLKSKDIEDILATCSICNSVENFHRPRKAAPGITIPKEATSQCCIYIDHHQIRPK